MHLNKIQTREQAVEFVSRIAERFYPDDDDSRWTVESQRLPEDVRLECCHAVAQIRRWQITPTLEVELTVITSMLELEEMAEQIDEPMQSMIQVAIASCACVYEGNWRHWVAEASESAMWYLAEEYGPGGCGGMENCYQIRELSEILDLPLNEIADDFDDIKTSRNSTKARTYEPRADLHRVWRTLHRLSARRGRPCFQARS